MSKDNNNSWNKGIIAFVTVLGGLYATLDYMAGKNKESDEIDENNPYIQLVSASRQGYVGISSIYAKWVKPAFDKTLSFMALFLLSPIFVLISIAIFIDDPGPVFFTQKRVGKNKNFFTLHKFRSMKMSTPHNVPTHQLRNPEQYITKVGKVLRKTSLDELPQIWDIFRGKMSIIGPRPALWNQRDLVTEREKYGANDIMPGLTGWAQINGRDELEIKEKAKLDGEYVEILRSGSLKGFVLDGKCFVKTVASVLKADGVMEGGMGERNIQKRLLLDSKNRSCNFVKKKMDISNSDSCCDDCAKYFRDIAFKRYIENISLSDAGFEDYGHRKTFHINTGITNHKKVLITGADSYVGESFRKYAMKHYEKNIMVDTLEMQDNAWQKKDFSLYDTVFHVAGIAHTDVGYVDEMMKAKYYAVNTDLAIETAKKAKIEGVRQFILMSSMIIYGDSAPYGKEKVINEYTLPAPVNFYGDSKWQADKGVRKLSDDTFHVAVLRPPMIYGKGSKGNYPKLAKLAKMLPIFPNVKNQRSMLYIENLSEFLSLLILSGEGGIYFPQNGEYITISRLVREIGITVGKPVYTSRILVPIVFYASHIPGKVGGVTNKVFGNFMYDRRLSTYDGFDYQLYDFRSSVIATESEESRFSESETA